MRSSYTSYKEAQSEKSLTKLAHYDNLPRIVSMLDNNLSRINEQDNKGRTALYIAMRNANLALVKLLLRRGANIDIKTNRGHTVLQVAVRCGHLEIVERLLAHDSSTINARDNKGSTLLHYASQINFPRMVALLLQNGAATDLQDQEGRTALHLAIPSWYYPDANQSDCLAVVDLLLNRGANIDIKTNRGHTVLQIAVRCEHVKIVERLLAHDPSTINARDNKGSTLLHYAFKATRFRMINLLLRCGANVNLQDQAGRTALHLAAQAVYGNEQVVQLMSHGAIIDKRDNQGRTPLHYAVTSSNNRENIQSTIQLLLENGAYRSISNEEKQDCTENKLQDSAVELALQMYWEEPIARILENESFYTTLLLTGFRPQRITLPESLQKVQDHIEDTMVEWINTKTLSISERRAMGSQILKALPTLIELIKLKEKIVSPYLPTDYAYQDIKILKEFLFIPQKECEQSQIKVLEALYENKSIPTEVVDLIQQSRVLGVFVDKLIDAFQLKRPAADYLMTNGNANQYMSFHKTIFSYNWKKGSCPPPVSLTSASP